MKVASIKGFDNKDYLVIITGILIYTILYAVSIISKVDSVEFMGIDPHSIVDSLNTLTTYPYYNMGDSYHSKYYGWSYLSFNFVILMISKLFGLVNEESFNIIVRTNLFLIGMLLTVALYVLSRHFFSRVLSACAVLYFIVDPISSYYFLMIHPETFGMLFLCLGLIVLLGLTKDKTFSLYKFIFSVVLFSISALAKQPFLIVNVCVGVVFFFWLYKNESYKLELKDIGRLMLLTALTFLLTFFIIHPYAFISFNSFITAQTELASGHSSVEISKALDAWFYEIANSIVFCLNLLILIFLVFLRRVHWAYICSVVLTLLIACLFVYKSRIFISLAYLYPLYVFAIFNVIYFLRIIANEITNTYLKNALFFIGVIFISCNLISNLSYSVLLSHLRFFSDGLGTKYETWDYIKNLNEESTIAYSPDVAMPMPYKANGCHSWQGCASYDDLSRFEPDVVILSPDYPYFEYADYQKYVDNNQYKLAKVVKPDYSLESYTCSNNSRVGITGFIIDQPFTLNFLNLNKLFSNISNCISDYSYSLDNYKEKSISGLPKYIYIKND